MLHLYRIYQLEEVIHGNLRPEKSQEVQKAGGKRKSYNLALDDSEAPEDGNTTPKKPRRKRAKKGVTRVVESGVIAAGEDFNAEVDEGRPLPGRRTEVNLKTTGQGGGVEEPKPKVVSGRRTRGKKEIVAGVEGGEVDTVRAVGKGKKPKAPGEQASTEGELPQARAKRVRKRRTRASADLSA